MTGLGEPVDFEVRDELPQLPRDGDVSLGMPEPDRRGDVEGALRAGSSPGSSAAAPARAGEVTQREVYWTGSRTWGECAWLPEQHGGARSSSATSSAR